MKQILLPLKHSPALSLRGEFHLIFRERFDVARRSRSHQRRLVTIDKAESKRCAVHAPAPARMSQSRQRKG
jgi:hypothetical protein